MSISTFGDIDALESYNANRKPIWTIALDAKDSEGELLKWLKAERDFLLEENEDRFNEIKKNRRLYSGELYNDAYQVNSRREDDQEIIQRKRKFVTPVLQEAVRQRVSRLIKYRPAIQVLPANDEQSDVVASKMTKSFLDNVWYINRFEGKLQPDFMRLVEVDGEAYLFIDWNESKGDIHPDFQKQFEKAQAGKGKLPKIPLLDENGEQELDAAGNKIYLEKEIRTGDIEYKIVSGLKVLFQKAEQFNESEYMFLMEKKQLEHLRVEYPDSAEFIKTDMFSISNVSDELMQSDGCTKYTFYHKRTKAVPNGLKIVFTDYGILEKSDFPFSHGDFPCERLTSLELPDEQHGFSYIREVKALVALYNNLNNMIYENIYLFSRPKWFAPAGSVDIKVFANQPTVGFFKGPQMPVLVQPNSTPSEVFKFRDELKAEILQHLGDYGMARGQPPAGVESAVALQFLAEQENERFNESVLKMNEWIRKVAIKTISVAGDMFDESDGRTIRILGKNNAWQTKYLDVMFLSRPYDIRVQNASALPATKALRMETLLKLKELFPDAVPQEQFLDMFDLAQSEKFTDIATVSVRAAEAENEIMDDGKFMNEPQEYEDHIQHWKIHVKRIQEFSFKNMANKQVQDAYRDHVMAHEYLMVQKSLENPAFAEQLNTLNLFPVFYKFKSQSDSVGQPSPQAPAPAQPVGPMSLAGLQEEKTQMPGTPVNGMLPSIETQISGEPSKVQLP